ncbi:isocitrate lyase/PEP mutase family protein [Aeoliella sp. ICT_H6.2]|uniref:Isocitrate lyase/PEP mutase family protein n=1 Tax=Aeoliella straminimaris TaxID=2954799 RepID=A0A9X2F662_9BACT|nr:isocitrate lyase/PEP mutase family protein [Aeoliella straminimaris]MCO6042945.1 isocitrate lyase/PEP mutase family protein [Aeoliella straminimaris]
MSTRIHQILEQSGTVVFPGIYDALSAKLAQEAGFELAFVSGFSVAATMLGEPDFGLLTQTEITDAARRICRAVDIPIVVDADTGYGNPLNVYRTVRELIEAGAVGCLLEDQVWPKKCGHMRGKRVVERGEYIEKIRAADEARRGHDFFLIARTDALAVHGIDEAIARVEAARTAGSDASFVEAPTSVELLAEIGRRSPGPNVANMIVGGRTPLKTKEELTELGFQLIVHPVGGLFAATSAIRKVFGELATTGDERGTAAEQVSFTEFTDIVGLEEKYAFAKRFGVE